MNAKKPSKRPGSGLGAIGTIFFLLAPAFLAGCGHANETEAEGTAKMPRAAVVKVERKNLSRELEIASEFQPYQEIYVYAKVAGYIQKLHIDWGTHVKQGQLLAVLEIPELQQQLEQDEAALRRSAQDTERAREEINRAQAAYGVAHLTYSRLAEVAKARPELVAQQEIDVAQGKDTEASAGVSAARDALAAADQSGLAAKAALEKAKAMYAYARISAPFEGVITEMDAFTGALLPAGTSSNKGDQALCRLSQTNPLRLVIPVPERAVADIHPGQSVAVSVSALHKTFEGKIARFAGQIDTQTRTMHTEVNVPNPKYELVPGMYASVQISLNTASNALTVPVQAIRRTGSNDGTALVVNGSNRIEKREVGVGLQTANSYEILSGLKEGEMVVIGEQNQFKPGDLVVPQAAEPPKME